MGRKSYRQLDARKSAIADQLNEEHLRDVAYTTGLYKYLRIFVHFLGALQFAYGVYYHWFRVHLPRSGNDEDEKAHWGGKFKFLTFLNAILQTIYHTLALLNDLFGSNALDPRPMPMLRKIRDYVFAAFAFPIAINVAISFWVVYAWDRELIFPAALDAIFPNWLNHIVHTNVAMLAVLDVFTCYRQYPLRKSAILGTTIFILSYIVWMHVVHYHSGHWVYPLLDVLNMPFRYLMLSAMVLFTLCCYFLGEGLNRIVWSPEMQLVKDKLKRQ